MSFSDYLENEIINNYLRTSTIYLALFTSDPTDAATGNEVSGNGYQRQPITLSTPSNGVTSNDALIEFPEATGDWGTLTHAAVYDAQTGGNMLIYGPLNRQKFVYAGDRVQFKAGEITFTID